MSTASEPITFLVSDIARLVRQRLDRAFAAGGLGVTPAEARTLYHVSSKPGLRQAALAEWLNIEPMTLVGFLDRLEKAGLVTRDADPSDRRAKLVRPTDAAAPIVAKIDAIVRAVRREATGELSPAQEEALRDGLTAMRARLASATVEEVA
jgi:DNA-binding MarR family transcriptional regulator